MPQTGADKSMVKVPLGVPGLKGRTATSRVTSEPVVLSSPRTSLAPGPPRSAYPRQVVSPQLAWASMTASTPGSGVTVTATLPPAGTVTS